MQFTLHRSPFFFCPKRLLRLLRNAMESEWEETLTENNKETGRAAGFSLPSERSAALPRHAASHSAITIVEFDFQKRYAFRCAWIALRARLVFDRVDPYPHPYV
ncbi:MAG: hypothetical protein WBQ03_18520 [Candidatus Sulfotelmatobacter sp.]